MSNSPIATAKGNKNTVSTSNIKNITAKFKNFTSNCILALPNVFIPHSYAELSTSSDLYPKTNPAITDATANAVDNIKNINKKNNSFKYYSLLSIMITEILLI